MHGPRECHTKGSKSDREGKISYDIPHVWNLNTNYTNELTCKTERDSQDSQPLENELMVAGGEGVGKGWLESFGRTCTHCCI